MDIFANPKVTPAAVELIAAMGKTLDSLTLDSLIVAARSHVASIADDSIAGHMTIEPPGFEALRIVWCRDSRQPWVLIETERVHLRNTVRYAEEFKRSPCATPALAEYIEEIEAYLRITAD